MIKLFLIKKIFIIYRINIKKKNNKTIRIKKDDKKKSLKTMKFKKINCAPGKDNGFTCYNSNSLEIMKNLWNKKHPDNKITSKTPIEIWKKLKNNFANTCDNEYCWLKLEFEKYGLDKKILKNRFAPFHPKLWNKNKNEWLSSYDLSRVMKGYEEIYKNFNFIGPSPIDFDKQLNKNSCVYDELCKFNLKSFINKGINKIAFIFNTDPHYKSGSHWISLFLDLEINLLFYFDSNGNKIPKQVKDFCNKIIEQGKSLNIKIKYDDNFGVIHQKSNTECGMFSLYFIITLLTKTHTANYFKNKNKKIKDKYVENLRKVYFNDPVFI